MRKRKVVVRLSDNSLSNTIFDSIGNKFKMPKIPDMNIGINPDTKNLLNGLLTGKTQLPAINVNVGLDPATKDVVDKGIKTLAASIAFVGLLSYLKSKNQ